MSMRLFVHYHVDVSMMSAVVAFLVCCLIGVMFGISPAHNASRLDPVEVSAARVMSDRGGL